MNSLWKHAIPYHIFEIETYPFHLTVREIKKLNPGDSIEFLCLDRNVDDFTDHNEENKIMSVSKFFSKAHQCKYTHVDGLKGMLMFDNINTEPFLFEFHLEWTKNYWYPLKDGKLKSDEQFNFPDEYENKSWESYSEKTRIGWRGPMILKKYYKYLPKVYRMDIMNHQDNVNFIFEQEN